MQTGLYHEHLKNVSDVESAVTVHITLDVITAVLARSTTRRFGR
jgi:hypothetical protein